MRTLVRSLLGLGLVTIGYVLGTSGILTPANLRAQEAQNAPREETAGKIKVAAEALMIAMQALQEDQRYTPAVSGINSFAVTAGGVDAVKDLETGRGVDPETFAALYADMATDEVAQHLGLDDERRLTYKNKVIRMYSIKRLKEMFADRAKLAGGEEIGE